jgi:signal transduction histidine kinase/ligand-binding sensor domain-containing protein
MRPIAEQITILPTREVNKFQYKLPTQTEHKMKKHSFSIVHLIPVMLLLPAVQITPLMAQTGGETFHHITSRDGLSSTFIWNMHQDRHGFIWIAGASGLDKFDGYSVTNFRHDPANENSISGGIIFEIMEDESGFIWFGTGSGLNIFNPLTNIFKLVNVPAYLEPMRGVRSVLETDEGSIWAGAQNGIYRLNNPDLNSDTLSADFYNQDSSGGTINGIWSIENGIDDHLWVGTDSGLYRFDLKTKRFVKPGPFSDELDQVLSGSIWTILKDHKNNIWISSESGFVVWRAGESEPELITDLGDGLLDLTDQYMQSITENSSGHLWIGTGTLGAFRYNPETGEVKTIRHKNDDSNSIAEDDVHYVFEDMDGNIWFGYHNYGISYMYSQYWDYAFNLVSEDHEPAHPVNYIHEIAEDESGNLWLATHQGLVLLPADGGRFKNFIPDVSVAVSAPANQLNSILSHNNHVVAISHTSQVYIFDISTEVFTQIRIPEEARPGFQKITYNDTHYILGGLNRKLIFINKSDFAVTLLDVPGREPDDNTLKPVGPVRDADGTVYVFSYFLIAQSTDWDIFELDASTQTLILSVIGSPRDVPVNFAPPHFPGKEPGVIWSVQANGFLRQDINNRVNQYYFQSDPGIIHESQKMILFDKDGFLWLGSRTGISRLDPETESITYYDADINRKPAVFYEPTQLENGDILFAGNGGFIRFDPENLESEPVIQNIHITELWYGSSVYNPLYGSIDNYRIDYANNNISFSFTGLNYRNPVSTRYRYRLSGYDDTWNEVGTQRRVFLANLPPGEYSFQVQAAQRYGSYGNNMAEYKLTILPPWWRTMPAYFAFSLLFLGGIFAVDRVQRKRVISRERERTREKELEQAKEIEIAYENLKAAQEQLVQQEKLASLGQLTAGIAHEIKNPLNFVNNFSAVSLELMDEACEELHQVKQDDHVTETLTILEDIRSNLKKIFEHGSRADGIVKSMLLHSRGGSGEFKPTDLNALIREYTNLAFHGMRAGQNPINVEIEMEMDENLGEIPLIAEDFSRVILNLCNNAFDAMTEKLNHSGNIVPEAYNPKLSVHTRREKNCISIDIEDNGPGIPDDIKDRILQPFFTTKKGTAGTGLGLSITYDIIKAHGGDLKIESSISGTKMSVTIHDHTKN